MAIEDKFWKSYLAGTKEEIKKQQKPNHLKQLSYAQCVGMGLTAMYLLPLITIPGVNIGICGVLGTDLICRTARRKKSNQNFLASGPGLVGTIRELYQKHKK